MLIEKFTSRLFSGHRCIHGKGQETDQVTVTVPDAYLRICPVSRAGLMYVSFPAFPLAATRSGQPE